MIFYDLRIQRAAGFQEQKPCRSNVTSNFSFLTPHNIRTGFIGQKVGDASELLRYGAGPHHRSWDLGVSLDHPAENHFSHIQVHAQAVTKKKKQSQRVTNSSRRSGGDEEGVRRTLWARCGRKEAGSGRSGGTNVQQSAGEPP